MVTLDDRHDTDDQTAHRYAGERAGRQRRATTFSEMSMDGGMPSGRVQMMRRGDWCCDTTLAVVSGRSLVITQPLDDLRRRRTRPSNPPPSSPQSSCQRIRSAQGH